MSKRTSILKALIEKFKLIDGNAPYNSNIFNNAYPIIKFWDEVNDFPCVYGSTGSETRDYLPGNFTWAYLGISLKMYCKGENAQQQLELLLEDIETVVNSNRVLVYDAVNNHETTEILVVSITTDEGLLAPYAVGELNLQVRYQLM
jgi:hypothetical protein